MTPNPDRQTCAVGTDPAAWEDFLRRFSRDLLRAPDIAADLPPEVAASG